LRKCVALLHIARAESFLKPVHALLRTSTSKRSAGCATACHALQPLIAHRGSRIQALANLIAIKQLSLMVEYPQMPQSNPPSVPDGPKAGLPLQSAASIRMSVWGI
jgi:hypothetical protein